MLRWLNMTIQSTVIMKSRQVGTEGSGAAGNAKNPELQQGRFIVNLAVTSIAFPPNTKYVVFPTEDAKSLNKLFLILKAFKILI